MLITILVILILLISIETVSELFIDIDLGKYGDAICGFLLLAVTMYLFFTEYLPEGLIIFATLIITLILSYVAKMNRAERRSLTLIFGLVQIATESAILIQQI